VRRFWGIKCGNNIAEEEVQDTDDGKLFFHTHDLWEVLDAVEKHYQCEIYGILALQDTVENLRHYIEFEESGKNPSFKCKIDDVPKSLVLEAHEYACHKIEHQDYDAMLDCVADYIIDRL
jgi:hypothetical protein